MSLIQLLLGLSLLFGALFLAEYLTRPRSVAWHVRRMTKRVHVLAQTIGERLAPAFEAAAVAVVGLTALLQDEINQVGESE